MFWKDPFADKYQKIEGFQARVVTPKGVERAWISMKPTTRAAYDLSMRENTIDGLITMDDLSKIKSGYIYTLLEDPGNTYFIQTLSKWQTQSKSLDFNAIRCNCKITVQRKGFADDTAEKSWIDIYKDVDASVSLKTNDSKNFNAGLENATYQTVQIPMWEFVKDDNSRVVEKAREVKVNDRIIIVSNISEDIIAEIAVESVDNIGVSGTIKAQGTQEMRT